MGPMGATTETGLGWATPVLSYAMACVGSALGLRCTVRALDASGRSKRNWLLTAAVVILAVGQSPLLFQIGRWVPAVGAFLRK